MFYSIYSPGERPHLILGFPRLLEPSSPLSRTPTIAVDDEVGSYPWREDMESILHMEKHQVEVLVRIYHRFIYSAFPVFDTSNIHVYLAELSKSGHYRDGHILGTVFQIFGIASIFAERAYGWDRNSGELLKMAKTYGILKGVDSNVGDVLLFQTRILVMLEYIFNSDFTRYMHLRRHYQYLF